MRRKNIFSKRESRFLRLGIYYHLAVKIYVNIRQNLI